MCSLLQQKFHVAKREGKGLTWVLSGYPMWSRPFTSSSRVPALNMGPKNNDLTNDCSRSPLERRFLLLFLYNHSFPFLCDS
jgi:hypothetical protein